MTFDKRTSDVVEATRSMVNRKPYRNAAEKAEARRTAVLCNDGVYRSNAPVRYHTKSMKE